MCIDGYWLNGNQCDLCDSKCVTCWGGQRYECTECVDNWYLDGYQCIQCHMNCDLCFWGSEYDCTKCNNGYYLDIQDTNNTCKAECPYKQYGDNWTDYWNPSCYHCHDNCTHCYNNTIDSCTGCVDDLFNDDNWWLRSNTCTLCDTNCTICTGWSHTDC
jgi:hypothetical protein